MNPAFNDDLDDYINRRKDKGKLQRKAFWNIKQKQKNRVREEYSSEEEIHRENGQEESREVRFSVFSIFRKRIPDEDALARQQVKKQDNTMSFQEEGKLQPQTLIVEDEDLEEEELEEEESKEIKDTGSNQGLMSRLFNFGNKKQEQEDQSMLLSQQQQDIDDMKETIKILHAWLEKLPPERIAEFKKSPDFEKYKNGLKKLGLIKE